jgi:hypothetical protein
MIQDLLNDVILKDGETLRLNCPSCGGYKTFTITKLSGVYSLELLQGIV